MSKKPLYPHVPKSRQPLYPRNTEGGKFIIRKDRMDNFIITHTQRPGLFILIEWDDGFVYSLKKGERPDTNDWSTEIKDTDPGAAIFHELWETAAKEERLLLTRDTIDFLASTEGDPISKFCCRLCGECAPAELLEEGRFPDRIAWLRSHYQAKHPGRWGQMTPMTFGDFGLVSPEYSHLASLVGEPLPEEAY